MIKKLNREELKEILYKRVLENDKGLLEMVVLMLNKQDEIIDKLNELEEK